MATNEGSSPSISAQPAAQPLFFTAAAAWLDTHQRYVRPNTVRSYRDGLHALIPVFGHLPIDQIQLTHIREYQRIRSAQITPGIVNRELGIFRLVMKEHDEWSRLERRYRNLPAPKRRAGHSLTAEEEQRLFEVAFTKKKWLLAAHCMVVMMNTTMGFGELRQLRRFDVDLERGCVTVREGAKNEYRHRTIPLNVRARESMEWILERWRKLGGGASDQEYILPHRPRGRRAAHWRKTIPWILTEPTTAMTSAFRSIREAAGLPDFRVYDCRVQAITKLLSNPHVSPQVSKEIAGHISQEMQNRYSIQQFNTKKAALDLIGPAPRPGGAL